MINVLYVQYGKVYLAEHTEDSAILPALYPKLAVKLMKADATEADSIDFLAEASTLRHFDHPNIVKVTCCGRSCAFVAFVFVLIEDGMLLISCVSACVLSFLECARHASHG